MISFDHPKRLRVSPQQHLELAQAVADAERLMPIIGPDKEALFARAAAILGDDWDWVREAIEGGWSVRLEVHQSEPPAANPK